MTSLWESLGSPPSRREGGLETRWRPPSPVAWPIPKGECLRGHPSPLPGRPAIERRKLAIEWLLIMWHIVAH
jgi:hypothetical protein